MTGPMIPRPAEVLIATGNAGKAREFRELLGGGGAQWRTLADFPGMAEVPETGDTFLCQRVPQGRRVRHVATRGGGSIADDSGLVVDALCGKPGVRTAPAGRRCTGLGAGDAANNALLLTQLADVPTPPDGPVRLRALALADPGRADRAHGLRARCRAGCSVAPRRATASVTTRCSCPART